MLDIASLLTPTQAELQMILKGITIFLRDLPNLELGDVVTRAIRVISWKCTVNQALIPVGLHLCRRWNWILQTTNVAYQWFLKASIQDRESTLPADHLPMAWEQIDSWMRSKLLEAIPLHTRDWVNLRSRQGCIDGSHVIIFYVLKQFGPGGAEEQVALYNNIINPHVCSQPHATQLELMRQKENIRRLAELNITPPAILPSYLALESIFSPVFDKADPQLNAR